MNNLVLFQIIKPEDRAAVLRGMDNLSRELGRIRPRSGPGAAERDFWIQLPKCSATMMELGWGVDLDALRKQPIDIDVINLRDRQMGENFLWLAGQWTPTICSIFDGYPRFLRIPESGLMSTISLKLSASDRIQRAGS